LADKREWEDAKAVARQKQLQRQQRETAVRLKHRSPTKKVGPKQVGKEETQDDMNHTSIDRDDLKKLIADQKELKALKSKAPQDHAQSMLLLQAQLTAKEKELTAKEKELQEMKSANAYNELEANETKESEAIATLTKENQTLQEQIEVLTQRVEDTNKIKKELNMHLQQLENQSRGKDKIYEKEKDLLDDEIAELKEEIGRLQGKVKELLHALKSAGGGSKMEQKAGVKDEIKNWINSVGFIDTKFALTTEAMGKLATDCYKEIAPRIGLEDEDSDSFLPLQDFIRIYSGFCSSILSEARQYYQTQCFAAVDSKSSELFLNLFRIS
jgi:hypothetical protein